MAKNKLEAALAVADVTNINDSLAVLGQLETKIKQITETVFKTNGVINYSPGGNKSIDLKGDKTNMKVVDVREAFASVYARLKYLQESNDILGLENAPVPTIDGGSIEDWTHDCKLAVAFITNHKKIEKANKLREKLTSLMGEQEKKELAYKELAAFAQEMGE